MSATLSAEQLAFYRDQGFASGLTIPDEEFAPVREACDAIARGNVGLPDFIRQPSLPRLDWLPNNGSDHSVPLFKIALSPAILDPIEQILGPDIVMYYTLLIAKPAGTGQEVPWHQDGHYAPVQPTNGLSAWIAIDDVDAGNGCMKFVPGSNRLGPVPHYKEDRKNLGNNHNIDRQYFDPDEAFDNVLKAGQFSLHDVFTIHGSQPNTSNRRRVALVITYMAATSFYDRGTPEHGKTAEREAAATALYPVWLVRGQNRHAANDFTTGHEGLELYDRLAAEAVRGAAARTG